MSKNIGQQRQAELLTNLSGQLATDQASGRQRTQTQVSDLADRLDALKDLLLDKLGSEATAQRAKAAVDGPVGDAIAQLDLARAHDLLADIGVKLNAIRSEVGEVHTQTTEIAKTLERQQAEEIQRGRQEEQRRSEAEERAKKAELESENDPRMFATAGLSGSMIAQTGGLQVYLGSPKTLSLPFSEPTLRIAFREGTGRAWLRILTDRQIFSNAELWKLAGYDFGDRAVVCFSAKNQKTGQRRQWNQTYTVHQIEELQYGQRFSRTNFAPSGEPTFVNLSDEKCDGLSVKEAETQQEKDGLDKRKLEEVSEREKASQFVKLSISGTARDGHLSIYVSSVPPSLIAAIIDPRVQVVFRTKGASASLIKLTEGPLGPTYWTAAVNDFGDSAVVCFAGRRSDSVASVRKRWTQRYTVQMETLTTRRAIARFSAEGSPTLGAANDETCDGISESKGYDQMKPAKVQNPLDFGHIAVLAERNINGAWIIAVGTSPGHARMTREDVHVEAIMTKTKGESRPLAFYKSIIGDRLENRFAEFDSLDDALVVCLSARGSAQPKPLRLTQWFAINPSRHGYGVTFTPSQPPTLAPVSGAPCL